MNREQFKKLKVGDEVTIIEGSTKYSGYISTLRYFISFKGVITMFDGDQALIKFSKPFRETYWFSPSWLETNETGIKDSNIIDDKTSKYEHPLAEVLRWIADGESLEYYHPGNNDWVELNTDVNFSIFKDFRYRKAEKKYQVLCKNDAVGFYIPANKLTKELAMKLKGFVKVLE